MLEKELAAAIELALSAGAKVMEFYASGVAVEKKFGADNQSEPVTVADRTASKHIVEGLAALFPEDGVLSEEEDDLVEIRAASRRVWMVDPIDGTWGFVKKDGDFGVQIGLCEGSEAVLGVVFLPASGLLYYAAKDEGAFVREGDGAAKRLQVSDETDFKRMSLATSRNHRSERMTRVVEKFGFLREVRRGSVGLKVGLVAERTCDLYIHLSPRTKYWDTCAPQVILEEAGGRLTDIFGEHIDYNLSDVQNHNGVLASNGAAHASAVKHLKPLLNEFGRLRVKAAKKTKD